MTAPVTLNANNIIGILIHDANQVASHLSVNGVSTDLDKLAAHLTTMIGWVEHLQAMRRPSDASGHSDMAN